MNWDRVHREDRLGHTDAEETHAIYRLTMAGMDKAHEDMRVQRILDRKAQRKEVTA